MSVDRRSLFVAGVGAGAAIAGRAVAQTAPVSPVPLKTPQPQYSTGQGALPYSENEIVHAASGFFGVAGEKIGAIIERAFRDNGRPTGYIAGNEGSGGLVVGVRYGSGELYMKNRRRTHVYWQGASAGFNFGGNLSHVFTLCYGLQDPAQLFHHYAGVEGSIYFVAGFGLNYLRSSEGVVLAPIHTGVGGQVNASVGTLDFSRKRHIAPF